jgi:hypothetical protein
LWRRLVGIRTRQKNLQIWSLSAQKAVWYLSCA